MTQPARTPRASDFMTEHVCAVTPDLSLSSVVEMLLEHGISNAPVIERRNDRKHLVGFISERDCLAALSDELFFGSPSPSQTATTVMRRHPVCVAPDTDLFALASIFSVHGFRHLPVVDGEELLGVVSRHDVLRAMNDYYREVYAEAEIKRHPPDLSQIVNQRFILRR